MKRFNLIGIVAAVACAKQAMPAATAPAERPLVEVCFSPYSRQGPGPPGYDALTTGQLTVRLVTDSTYGVQSAQPTATIVSGSIDLAKRTHTLDTRSLIGYRQNSLAWTWASTDSILVEIGHAGSHSSSLCGSSGSADRSTLLQGSGTGRATESTTVHSCCQD